MLVFVIWNNPAGRKPGVWSELFQEPFENWDAARAFIHKRKALNGAEKYQMRNLDPILRRAGLRAVPTGVVRALSPTGEESIEEFRKKVGEEKFDKAMELSLSIYETVDL